MAQLIKKYLFTNSIIIFKYKIVYCDYLYGKLIIVQIIIKKQFSIASHYYKIYILKILSSPF